MPNSITPRHKLNTIQLLRNDIDSNTSPYFVFLGRHVPFRDADQVNIDGTPPQVDMSVEKTNYDIYRNMLCAKYITKSDTAPVVKYTEWTSGSVYNQYEHTDGQLSNKIWYVAIKRGVSRDVFICLSNNGGRPSTIAPNYHDTLPQEAGGYETSDGYRWKYMYTVSQEQYLKFATPQYLPVIENTEVSGNSVSGAINFVKVNYGGSQYDSYHTGLIVESRTGGSDFAYVISNSASSNNDFYTNCAITITSGPGTGQIREITNYDGISRTVNINEKFDTTPTTASTYDITPLVVLIGDGTGFSARALVNASASNTIYKVEIIDSGQNYTWASAEVTGNTGGTTNYAIITPIISPFGGHGSNQAKELISTTLCISTKFNSTESSGKVLDVNEFRNVGLIKNAAFANVELTVNNSEGFFVGDQLTQLSTGAYGIITSVSQTHLLLTNVIGYFNSTSNVYTSTANTTITAVDGQRAYVDQTVKLSVSGVSGVYTADERVDQTTSAVTAANGIVYHADIAAGTGTLYLTNVYGLFTENAEDEAGGSDTITGNTSLAQSTILSATQGDFVIGSGDVLYIDNKSPISKSQGQTETVKIILEF
jgi:hypothetical protein